MQNKKIIKQAEYLNIINILIEKYNFSSLLKVVITALVLYYQANNIELRKSPYNLLFGFFGALHLILLTNYMDFKFISEAILINEKNNKITINNDEIIKNTRLEFVKNNYMDKDNIQEILIMINNLSIDSFAQEVLANV